MNAALNDLRIALRQHARQPGFAVTVILTLAVTIGATTAVFSVVNAVLIRALPFASPDRLFWIASVRADNANAPFSLPEFMDYRAQTRTVSGLAAYANWSASLAGDDRTERLQGARMSANAFDVLGVAPSVGRLLTDSDDRPDAPGVVVLSYRLWQRRYGGRADVVGQAVRINTESFTVVGVTACSVSAAAPGSRRDHPPGARTRSAPTCAQFREFLESLRPTGGGRRSPRGRGGTDRDLPVAAPAVSRRVRTQGRGSSDAPA